MLGGVNNAAFFQGFIGFLGLIILIPLMAWTFDTDKNKRARVARRALKRDLRRLKRK